MNNEYKTFIKCPEPDPRIGFFFFNTEMKFSLMKLARQFFQTGCCYENMHDHFIKCVSTLYIGAGCWSFSGRNKRHKRLLLKRQFGWKSRVWTWILPDGKTLLNVQGKFCTFLYYMTKSP